MPATRTRTTRNIAAGLLVLAAVPPAWAHHVKLKDLEIVHPSTTEPAGAANTEMVVTMTIHNRGKAADRLIGADSTVAVSTELASGGSTTGTAIDLPAAGTVAFSKTGPHIVLHGIKKPMTGYATFPLKLTFEKAGTVEAEVLVEENSAAMSGDSKEKPKDAAKR